MIVFKCLAPSRIHELEASPCVYVIFLGLEPLYVGSTSNARRRAKQHFVHGNSILAEKLSRALGKEKAMEMLSRTVLCVHYTKNLDEAQELERELIAMLQPRMNTKFVKKKRCPKNLRG